MDDLQIKAPNFIKKIIIYDVIGNKVKEFHVGNNTSKLSLNMNELTPGIYFTEIYYADNTSVIRKITKQ
jgi:hypothetical protein